MRKPKSTSAQLRDDIDRRLTGEKVAAKDPAAVPLGTDDEAAGTPGWFAAQSSDLPQAASSNSRITK